jgi:hypothetical protein
VVGGGAMRKERVQTKKKAKKPVELSQAVKARCWGRTAQIRISHENKAILEKIQEKLEILYADEMVGLGMKTLTIDGAITQVLDAALIEWSLPVTMLEEDSSYLRVQKAAYKKDGEKEV